MAYRLLLFLLLCETAPALNIFGPSLQQASLGSNVLLTCTFFVPNTHVDPNSLVVVWYANEREILRYDKKVVRSDSRIIFSEESARNGNASISLHNVTIMDEGRYTCLVIYNTDHDDISMTLEVQAPPVVRITSMSGNGNQGDTLCCAVTGFYPAEIYIDWLEDGMILEQSVIGRAITSKDQCYSINSTVAINPSNKHQHKTYTCRVQHLSLLRPLRVDFHFNKTESSKKSNVVLPIVIVLAIIVIVTPTIIFTLRKFKKKAAEDAGKLTRKTKAEKDVYVEQGWTDSWHTEEEHSLLEYETTTRTGTQTLSISPHYDIHTESEEFTNLLGLLKMEKYISNKLTLEDILEISAENNKDNKPQKIEDVPWCTLRKIMALDITARNTQYDTDAGKEIDPFEDIYEDPQSSCSIHPLDVLCVLLHCSDSILQQEIVSKMSMCQFAVPLLLPAGDGSRCTFMLWAMRDIVKKWTPQSLADTKWFREENVVNISMPLISFVRLGKTKLSKSKTLNQVLNPAQQHHNFFIHDDMEGGNIERKISEGLVEISWYFPSSKSDVLPEPFAGANLRGDLETNWKQFTFLSEISSAVFIFMETINEREFQLLSKCSQCDTIFFFVVTPCQGKDIERETLSILLRLLPELRSEKEHVVFKSKSENNASFIKKIQSKFHNILSKCSKNVMLRDLHKFFW